MRPRRTLARHVFRHFSRLLTSGGRAADSRGALGEQVERVKNLKIGTRVFYPPHGVASVLGVEERELESNAQSFYVLGLTRGRVLLPVDKATPIGLRKLVSATKARELLKLVNTEPGSRRTASPRERANEYADVLRDGSADGYTEVLRALLFRARAGKLSASDRKVLEVARDYFVSEMSAVLDKPGAEIQAMLQ